MAKVSATTQVTDAFIQRLHQFSELDSDFWSFRSSTRREGRHGLCAYPAMMVPEMQGLILDEWQRIVGSSGSVLDPFVGAGTTLVECVRRNIPFTGIDINPLAIMICEAKTIDRPSSELRGIIRRIRLRLNRDCSSTIEVKFFGRDKWCSKALCIALSRIRRAVNTEGDAGIRKACWAVLTDVIRKFSNSRPETYKLHVRAANVGATAQEIVACFTERLAHAFTILEVPLLTDRHRVPNETFSVVHGDARDAKFVPMQKRPTLILSSPPYGDNRTTVPYGQFSYLALNWIPPRDVKAAETLCRNTHAIDFISLGGSCRRIGAHEELLEASPTYRRLRSQLMRTSNAQAVGKVTSFFGELFESFRQVNSLLDRGGVSIWTTGDRKVSGIKVPLSTILCESALAIGAREASTLSRAIPSKRFPSRNATGHTISREEVVLLSF